jgi:hypothetical protein
MRHAAPLLNRQKEIAGCCMDVIFWVRAMSMLSRTTALLMAFQIAAMLPALAGQGAPPAPKPEALKVNVATLTLMIKGAVIALHQANVTGNYSVLRDLGTPLFRETFDQASLTERFQNIRSRKIDLSIALLLSPHLTKNPEWNQNHELLLVGDFPTSPLRIHFELAFMPLDGAWRLAGISVDAIPSNVANAAPNTAQKHQDWSTSSTKP